MTDNVLPLSAWLWLGLPLEPAIEPVDQADSFQLTCWVVDQLRKSKYNDVRELIEGDQHIKRLIELKELRERGNKVLPKIHFDRQQKMSSLAAFLTLDRVNTKPCQQCQNQKSKGPCRECIAGGPTRFNGIASSLAQLLYARSIKVASGSELAMTLHQMTRATSLSICSTRSLISLLGTWRY